MSNTAEQKDKELTKFEAYLLTLPALSNDELAKLNFEVWHEARKRTAEGVQ